MSKIKTYIIENLGEEAFDNIDYLGAERGYELQRKIWHINSWGGACAQ